MGDIRLGFIGTGRWALRRAQAFAEVRGVSVTLGWSRSERSRERFRQEVGAPATERWQAVCESDQVDAVLIATPHLFHSEQARAALDGGKHVFVETPLCLHYSEAQELAELAAPRGLVIHHGAKRRYHPEHSRDIEGLRSAGALVYAEDTVTFDGGDERPWYRNFELSGGAFAFLSYEAVDFFEAFGPVERTQGQHVRRDKLDVATMWIWFAEGGQAKITYGIGENIASVYAGLVIGTEGAVQWGEGIPRRLIKGSDITELPQPGEVDLVLCECEAFADEIRGVRDFRPELNLDLQILKAVSDAQEKAGKGKDVYEDVS